MVLYKYRKTTQGGIKMKTAQYLTDRHPNGGLVKVVSMGAATATVYYVHDRKRENIKVDVKDLLIIE